MLDHIGDATARDTTDHQIHQQIGKVTAAREFLGQFPADEETDSHARTIGVQREEIKFDEVWKHIRYYIIFG